eukprot:1504282-Lingulodinium_polyedra.AAC.1
MWSQVLTRTHARRRPRLVCAGVTGRRARPRAGRRYPRLGASHADRVGGQASPSTARGCSGVPAATRRGRQITC